MPIILPPFAILVWCRSINAIGLVFSEQRAFQHCSFHTNNGRYCRALDVVCSVEHVKNIEISRWQKNVYEWHIVNVVIVI